MYLSLSVNLGVRPDSETERRFSRKVVVGVALDDMSKYGLKGDKSEARCGSQFHKCPFASCTFIKECTFIEHNVWGPKQLLKHTCSFRTKMVWPLGVVFNTVWGCNTQCFRRLLQTTTFGNVAALSRGLGGANQF